MPIQNRIEAATEQAIYTEFKRAAALDEAARQKKSFVRLAKIATSSPRSRRSLEWSQT
jgi:hypothetical protein